MTSTRAPYPTKVRSPRGAAATEIDWSDGKTTRHPHRILRGLCPCAKCQGHDHGIRWVDAVETASNLMLEVNHLEQVGNYAVGLTWADGHNGGIYTFEYLRELGRLEAWPLEHLRAYRPRQ
ncbi:MAG TPA: DUF971 domain-containing protein [Polyangiaceae bacterium]|nr:DUF971 domain-containing protein [Polyangiaceae bacterium]